MTLKQLQLFKRTAELENISRASRELFISQPALSKAVSDLEKELGYPLFERTGKKIVLNANGDILLRYTNRILSNITQLEGELREKNEAVSSAVTVSVRVASRLLPELLNSYYRKHPHANVTVYQLNAATKNQPDYDIVIDSCETPEEVTGGYQQILLEEQILAAIPASHPLAEKEDLRLSDFAEFPCCLLHEDSSLGKLVRNRFTSSSFLPNVIFESDNPSMIRDFLGLGVSYSFVPELSWRIARDFPNLVLREVSDFGCRRYVYLSYPNREYLSSSALAFAKHVVDFFANLQYSSST